MIDKLRNSKIYSKLSYLWIYALTLVFPKIAHADWFVSIPYYGQGGECGSVSSAAGEIGANPWWSGPFDVVSNAAVSLANGTYSKVAGGMLQVVAVGLALWIAVFTLKVVGSMVESNPLDNVTKIFGMLLKGAFAAVLLTNSNILFSYFVSPIIEFGAGVGGVSSGSASSASGLFGATSSLKSILMSTHNQVSTTQAKGSVLMCISQVWSLDFGLGSIDAIIDPGTWTQGCALYCIVWVLSVIWPLLVFDALMRLGITGALTPLFVGAWVFPCTASYTQKGFNSFLNVAFFYVCLKFVITIGLKLLEATSGVSGMTSDAGDSWAQAVCKTCMFHVKDCSENTQTTSLMLFMAASFYVFYFLKEATTFANYFSDAGFSNDQAFQAAASTGNMMKKGVSMAMKVGAAGVDKVKQDVNRARVRRVNEVRYGAAKGDLNKLSASQRKQYLKDERKLRENGVLNAVSGAETEQFGKLLKLGRRRTFVNWATKGKAFADDRKAYENWMAVDHSRKEKK
ncbi:MAG: type IV secretion system protein [Alphaproteobacteria bacterium]|nr:type IV secretion system protein [Alphaproteobacteria bacterium]